LKKTLNLGDDVKITPKDGFGLLHLPIGIIICFYSIEYLRWTLHPYFASLVCLMGLCFIFVGLANLFWVLGITKDKNPEQR